MEREAEISFEAAMARLEEITGQLENDDVALEQAIELFQEGMELSRWCGLKLEEAERKIEMLVEENGRLVKKPFSVSDQEKGDHARD